MDHKIALCLSITNGLQYGVFANVFSRPAMKLMLKNYTSTPFKEHLIAPLGKISSLAGTLTISLLQAHLSNLQISQIVTALNVIFACISLLFAINSNFILFFRFVFGYTTQIQTTVIPIIVARLDEKSKSQFNTIFQLCVNIGLIGSTTILWLLNTYISYYISGSINMMIFLGFNAIMLLSLTFIKIDENQSKSNISETKETIFSQLRQHKMSAKIGVKIAFLIAFQQQITGVAQYDVYGTEMLKGLFPSINAGEIIGTLILQLLDVFLVSISSFLVKICKRKPLFFYCLIGCALCNVIFCFVDILNLNANINFMTRVLFEICFQLAPCALYYALSTEIFSSDMQNQYFALTQLFKRLMNVAVVLLYSLMPRWLHCIIFGTGCLFALLGILRYFPETFQMSQHDINVFYQDLDLSEESSEKQL